MRSRFAFVVGLLLVLTSGQTFGGEATPSPAETNRAAAWTTSVSGYYFAYPKASDYFVGIASANRDALHLEARWNYENIDAGSVFVGWNFAAGEWLKVSVTPLLGMVFGTTRGIAPGVELAAVAAPFDFYFEGEYVFDWRGGSESFFYAWSELAVTPLDWLRTGLVAQRTVTNQSDRNLQRGGFCQVLFHRRANVAVYFFNPGSSDWYVATGIELRF